MRCAVPLDKVFFESFHFQSAIIGAKEATRNESTQDYTKLGGPKKLHGFVGSAFNSFK